MKAKSCHETIRYASGNSSLGTVLVAATETGTCALLIGDDPAELAAELQRRFPEAQLSGGDESLHRLLDRAVSHVEDPTQAWDPPLDLRGTAFQQRVWQELRKIPAGSTESYTRIAAKIGRPGAARAVAGACAANHVAVAVPCHRVVRGDGSLSGYRWGVERKRALLEREAEA